MQDLRRLTQAAEQRREAVGMLTDRPRQRRAAPGGDSFAAVVKATLHLRETGNGNGISFEGVASAYESPYDMYDAFGPYTEVVSRGAGAKSLAQPGLDVPLVLGHDSMRRIARTSNGTLQLSENNRGLQVLAPNLDPEDYDVQYIAPKIRSGLIDEMSFAFRITRGIWSPDFTEYRIDEYDINRGDVAIVGYGANPNTTANVRHMTGADLIPIDETKRIPFV